MYADTISEAMELAIKETNRRREIQEKYNIEHGIIPKTIKKEIRDLISNYDEEVKSKKDALKDFEKAERQDLIDFAHAFRQVTDKIHIECLFSYRTISRIAELEDIIPNIWENLQISLFKGLNEDDINMIEKELLKVPGMRFNKYVKSMSNHNLITTKDGSVKESTPFEFF